MPDQGAVSDGIAALHHAVINCQRCPRLVAHRSQVASTKKPAYQDQPYWGRPVPGWGDLQARLLVLGLAPGAHGANRTGLPFSGDSSGNILLPALKRAGFASLKLRSTNHRIHPTDYQLQDAYLTNVVRCAPPANLPEAQERDNCQPFLAAEIHLLGNLQVILALGGYAYTAGLLALQRLGIDPPRPRPGFSHSLNLKLPPYVLICSYHPSRRNTQTGLLTVEMLDAILQTCKSLLKE